MNCRVTEQELSSYLDGELPQIRAARLAAHLRKCSHCQEELRAMSGIAGHIRAASHGIEASRDFDQRVLRAVGYYQTSGRYARRSFEKPLTIVALVLLGLLGLIRHFFAEPVWPPVGARQPSAAIVAPAVPSPAFSDRR